MHSPRPSRTAVTSHRPPVRRPLGHAPKACSLATAGTLGSEEFSTRTKSTLYFASVDLIHWPPRIGVATTLVLGPLPHCRRPIGVCTSSPPIALARPTLSFGFCAACSAAAATSNSARLGPSCWFHCLPAVVW